MTENEETGRNVTIDGFEVETRFGMRYARATFNRPYFMDVEVEVGEESINVRCEEGSGYSAQITSVDVPFAVIAEMMRAAGWTMEPPPRNE